MTGIDNERRDTFFVSIFLVLMTLLLYLRVWDYHFVNFDDDYYVLKNTGVNVGVTIDGIWWAFTTTYAANWHPLTWLSHMLDCQLFGLNPGPHHIVNILIHAVSVLLLFLVLHRMTKALWQSAFVAVVFAIHPLHVESVAWIAERKDVLSALFWMLTLGAYVRYAERPVVMRYIPVLGFFTLGLLAKPMLVTLPCVLLLLDYWPLRRIRFGIAEARSNGVAAASVTSRKSKKERLRAASKQATANIPDVVSFPQASVMFLIKEKIPLILIALVSGVVTIYAQQAGGVMASLQQLPFTARIANMLVSYVQYLGKAFWPVDLAVTYPYSSSLSMGQVLFSAFLLLSVTVFVIWAFKRFPYLIVGWLWYLGTLVPVIGLVQVGIQSMADRYTYLPLIGICMMIGWGTSDLLKGRRFQKITLIVTSLIILCVLAVVTWRQLGYWHDSISLFRHTIAVTENNSVAHNHLGRALKDEGKLEQAIAHFKEAIRIEPTDIEAHINLGNTLIDQGKVQEARLHLTQVLALFPDNPKVHYNMGTFLAGQGEIYGAIDHFREAIRIDQTYVDAHFKLANALMTQGKSQEAILHLIKALTIRPNDPEINYNMGTFLARQGDLSGAVGYFRAAIRLQPEFAKAHNNLGSALLHQGKIGEAVRHFEEALRINPRYEMARVNLQEASNYLKGPQNKIGGNGQP